MVQPVCVKIKNKKRGYITLISMLVIAIVGTSLVAATLFNGTGTIKTSLSYNQAVEASILAESCAEKALEEIWKADNYVGTGNLNLGNGSCSYAVNNTSVPKIIESVAIVGTVVKKFSLTVDSLHPYIQASAWLAVP